MSLCLRVLALLACSLALACYALATEEGPEEALGLSDYRYFRVYPHLERAQKALKANDEQRAIGSFQHAHQLAPNSLPLTLLLADAWRHFQHDDKARELLSQQLRKTPGNMQVRAALDAIPQPAKNVIRREQLLRMAEECNLSPSEACRQEVGHYAVNLGELDLALTQLNDEAFRVSSGGQALLNNLTQRAISLQQWQMADRGFALHDRLATLNDEQYQQWFAILLHLGRDRRILDLQQQGVMNSPGMQLAYAQSLAERKKFSALRVYLAGRNPHFSTRSEKRNWHCLVAAWGGKASQNNPEPFIAAEKK